MLVSPLDKYNNRVVIIDYGMSNLFSVRNALKRLGCDAEVVTHPSGILNADRIILPGVGAFASGMNSIKTLGFDEAIHQVVDRERPFLGICLGMQLLATQGFENGFELGLDLIPGDVRRLKGDSKLRIPHIGWNEVNIEPGNSIYKGLGSSADFYFVHSYHFEPTSSQHVTGWCNYSQRFAASIQLGSVMGLQYHPEKSHRAGLETLKNFLTL
jgi:glutamine amidotransferase